MDIDDPPEKIDPTFSCNISRRRFIKLSVGAVTCVSLSSLLSGCGGNQSQGGNPPGYPISSEVYTTRQRVIQPVSGSNVNTLPWKPSTFQGNGYGQWQYLTPGIDYGKDKSIMPDNYDISKVTNIASLLNFFTIADTHVYDKESPSQPFCLLMNTAITSSPTLPAITFTMLYTTHILDAAIQTVNAIHKQKPFDCGLFLGDAANNSQYNEIRWYIDVIDGQFITPSSGAHAGADTIDYQKPYQAAGLDKTIPWYQTKGSHDNFWFGSNPVIPYLQQNYIGGNILCVGNIFNTLDPNSFNERDYYMGTVDGSTPYGDIIGAGPVGTTNAISIAADTDRRSLDMKAWMNEFLNTTSNPVGHGFTQNNVNNNFASYSFEPKANIPIKIIMLDDTQSEQSEDVLSPPAPYGNGSLDNARYTWLLSELDKGQAEGQLMIIATHVPIDVLLFQSGKTGSWGVPGALNGADTCIKDTSLVTILNSGKYPNFILWLAGHQHNNQVTPFKSPDSNHPEYGFWEVQTASLRDFPQQFRTFDIVRNSDNTISIIITNVDPAVADGSPAAMSRVYAVAANQLYNTPDMVSTANSNTLPVTPTGVYNAELIVPLSPEMQTKIQNYGTPIQK